MDLITNNLDVWILVQIIKNNVDRTTLRLFDKLTAQGERIPTVRAEPVEAHTQQDNK